MKLTKQNILMCCLLTMALLAACERDFDNINKDPNGITDVPSDYLLPGAVMSLSNAENGFMESFAYASDWVQHMSCGFWTDPGRYNFEKSRSFMWDNLYTGPLIDLKVMNRKAVQEGNVSLEAVSLILHSYGFALLADCYGPIPYSQALEAETGVNKPAYDAEETVYHALLDSLEKANRLLAGLQRIEVKSGYDVLFDGNALKWQKFCNALRLRMMVRISGRAEVSTRLQSMLSDPESPLPASNDDNVSFKYSAASVRTWHPLFDVLSSEASDGGYRISKTLADLMVSSSDPRLEVYADPNTSGEYAGLPAGAGAGAGQIDQYSRIDARYGNKERPGVFISYSEVNFLLAEAAGKNLIEGDARQWYEEAIRANFDELGLPAQQYADYIGSSFGRYTNTDRIAMQKWIALFGRGLEAWTEWRRTGIPALQPAQFPLIEGIPLRFLYPLSEEQTNREQMKKASETLLSGDLLTSKLWWMN